MYDNPKALKIYHALAGAEGQGRRDAQQEPLRLLDIPDEFFTLADAADAAAGGPCMMRRMRARPSESERRAGYTPTFTIRQAARRRRRAGCALSPYRSRPSSASCLPRAYWRSACCDGGWATIR